MVPKIDAETRELLNYLHLQVVEMDRVPWAVNDYETDDPEIRIRYVSDKSDDDSVINLRGTLTTLTASYQSLRCNLRLNQRKSDYYFEFRADTNSSINVRGRRDDQVDDYIGKLVSFEILETPDLDADDDETEATA